MGTFRSAARGKKNFHNYYARSENSNYLQSDGRLSPDCFYFLQAEVSLYKQTGNYRLSYLTVSGLFILCFICSTLLLPG